MAAADYVIVPSRFEPCGLVAQAGARYGAVPIVAAVGGLKDLVTPEASAVGTPRGRDGCCAGPGALAWRAPAVCSCARLQAHAGLPRRVLLAHLPPPSLPPTGAPLTLTPRTGAQVGYTLPGFSHAGTAADQRQNVQQLLAVIRQAAAEYGTPRYRALQQRCMSLDVSWERPAAEWEQLLARVAGQAPGRARAA